jgi:transcriptional regulator with XRE-family HTH domain
MAEKSVMVPNIFGLPNDVNTLFGTPNRTSVPMRRMSIGARITQARKQQGLSPKALADAVGLAASTLNELENGESKSTTKLHRIAAVLKKSPEWFETGRVNKSLSDAAERVANQASQVTQHPVSIHKNTEQSSRILRLDPVMIRDGFNAVNAFFTERGSVFQVDVDPDLLARAYMWAQTADDALLDSIDADVEARLRERGAVKHGNKQGKAARAMDSSQGRSRKRGG